MSTQILVPHTPSMVSAVGSGCSSVWNKSIPIVKENNAMKNITKQKSGR